MYFIKIKSGTHSFRTWKIKFYVYEVETRKDYEMPWSFNGWGGSWTNATYGEEMRNKEMIERILEENLPLTPWKRYRTNGKYCWVKRMKFNSEEEAQQKVKEIEDRIHKIFLERQKEEVEKEVMS